MKYFTKKQPVSLLLSGAVALITLSFQACVKNNNAVKPAPELAANITDADGDFAGGLSSDTGTTISKGLLAYWPLAGNAYDFSGNRNDEVSYNVTPATDRLGNTGGAYNFNGTSSHIDITSTSTTNISNTDFSLNAWVNIPAYKAKNTADILNAKPTEQTGWHFYITGSDGTTPGLVGFSHKASEKNYTSKTAVGLNGWHMVTVTYKIANKTLKIHLDGKLDKTIANVYGPDGALSRLFIGRQNSAAGDGNFFTGAMSDIRIYNRALTGAEIKYLHYIPIAPTNGLIGHWSFSRTAADFAWASPNKKYSDGVPLRVEATTDRHGNPIGAYKFNSGKTSVVTFAHTLGIGGSGGTGTSGTFSIWIRLPEYSASNSPIASFAVGSDQTHSSYLYIDNTGRVNLSVSGGTTLKGRNPVPLNQWHMITLNYNSSGTLMLYQDNFLDKEFGVNLPQLNLYRIGESPVGTTDVYLRGMINDVREYNRALSDGEMHQLYQALN